MVKLKAMSLQVVQPLLMGSKKLSHLLYYNRSFREQDLDSECCKLKNIHNNLTQIRWQPVNKYTHRSGNQTLIAENGVAKMEVIQSTTKILRFVTWTSYLSGKLMYMNLSIVMRNMLRKSPTIANTYTVVADLQAISHER